MNVPARRPALLAALSVTLVTPPHAPQVTVHAGTPLLVVTGVNLTALETPGTRPAALQALTRQVYARYADNADFLLLIANRRHIPASTPILGYQYRVKNAVRGLGVPTFNGGAPFGTRHLQGVLYFPRWTAFWRAPFLHEFAHQWANDALPTTEAGHFGTCSGGSQLGGFTHLNTTGPRTYRGLNARNEPFGTASNGNHVPYSALELYLMGLLPPQHVPPLKCAAGVHWIDEARGTFHADQLTTITIQDLVRRNGPRQPDQAHAPHTFTILPVLVSSGPPTDADVRGAWNAIRTLTLAGDNGDSTLNFFEATRGLGRLAWRWPQAR